MHFQDGDRDSVSFSMIVGNATLSCHETIAATIVEQSFSCFRLTRYILFRGEVTFRLLKASGHGKQILKCCYILLNFLNLWFVFCNLTKDSRLDNYLGCFKPQRTRRRVLNTTSLASCFSKCPRFFGLKSVKKTAQSIEIY